MPINLRAHEFAISPGLARPQLVATHFYMRLQGEGAEAPAVHSRRPRVCRGGRGL